MSRVSSRCKIAVVFLLILVWAAPWMSASEIRGRAEPRVQQLPAASLWELLGSGWEVVSSLWTKAGGSADPSGNPGSWIKAGGSLDPDGKPTSQPAPTCTTTNSDAGASAEPNG
jgi:hypothetical protein